MTKNMLLFFSAALLLTGIAVKADEVLFDGTKGKLTNTVVQADPEKADNKVGFWQGAVKGRAMGIKPASQDCSKYKALTFRIYSAKADGHGFTVVCYSDRKETKGCDYFYKKIKIDWKGWKTFVIPLVKFGKARKPIGWKLITSISFNNHGWGFKPNKDAKYFIDDLKLLSKLPAVSSK